jgi:hypothetical protein
MTTDFAKQIFCRKSQLFGNPGTREQLAELETLVLIAIAQNPIVANFHEALGQDMQQEATNEFRSGKRHDFPLAAVFVVPPLEDDLAVCG